MSKWFDPTTVPTGVAPEPEQPPVPASQTQPLSETTAVEVDNPAADSPTTGSTVAAETSAASDNTAAPENVAADDGPEVPVAHGGSRRRKLLISIAAVAAVTGFLVVPRGDGYTPSFPFASQQPQAGEEAASLPTAAEATKIDQVAAQETFAATGNYNAFTPATTPGGSSTWLTSSTSLVVFRSTPEGTCLLYGAVDGTPTDVQSHSSNACTETSVQAVAVQLSSTTGQPTRQFSSQGNRDMELGTDTPNSPAPKQAGASTDAITVEGLKAQNYALKTGSFVGYSANGVVVMDVSDNAISLTTDARSGCPAVTVDVNNVTQTC